MNAATEGFRPAHRLVDLANLVRRDPGAPRHRLTELLAAHGESTDDLSSLTDTDAARLRAVAAEFGDLLSLTDVDTTAHAINALLDAHAAHPRLSNHDGHAWHLHIERDSDWGTWLAASGALALAQLLSERGRPAWGECAAVNCRNLFLDDGPGSARRYCSATCASRARVAEHRARKRGTAEASKTSDRLSACCLTAASLVCGRERRRARHRAGESPVPRMPWQTPDRGAGENHGPQYGQHLRALPDLRRPRLSRRRGH